MIELDLVVCWCQYTGTCLSWICLCFGSKSNRTAIDLGLVVFCARTQEKMS